MFFCQLEAIKTLIWLTESPDAEKQGINIPSDGGPFERLCCKMATGSGKTVVMAMAIAWQVLNKVTYPQDARFSKNILIISPSLTVRSRLRVLCPGQIDNFYDKFNIVPESLRENLHRMHISIHNWHKLMPEIDAPASVVKLGAESNSAFSKRILEHDLNNIIVINDEAHHAYRAIDQNTSSKKIERDKRWVEGLDKIHAARSITHCFDFSATPFVASGRDASEEDLFEWIVSDFSLNDAIESGLTKTPRIVIRDDSNTFSKDDKSRFYHLYMDNDVKSELNRNVKENEKLPDLVANAYFVLGQDWIATKKLWDKCNSPIPPVMITVCNKTQTAARVRHSFENGRFGLEELSKKEHLLHIDSRVLDKAETSGRVTADVEDLRKLVDTVGKQGQPGEQIRNIIAVQMLSEGWDASNVTHIMGLRAFTSQLLCEQVVGRGLRRTSYEIDASTGLFAPEYVNVFGVPFTFMPHESGDSPPPPPQPTILIEPDPAKSEHEISWPNIDRIDTDYGTKIDVDWSKMKKLTLRSDDVSTTAGMAQVLAGKPHLDKMSDIDLRKLDAEIRMQRIIFIAAKDLYESLAPSWNNGKGILMGQVVRIIESFITSKMIRVENVTDDDVLRKKMTMLFNMDKIVRHVWSKITDHSVVRSIIQLNPSKPVRSTHDARPWYTKKPTEYATKSHMRLAPYDSKWELGCMQELERNSDVKSWVKNDHLGFVIKYVYNGTVRDYWPDFLIHLRNGVTLVLEIKGIDNDQNKEKRKYLKEWVDVVNKDGGYGTWVQDVAFQPSEVKVIIRKHMKTRESAKEHAKCPQCGVVAVDRQSVEEKFGFRKVGGMVRPQSWCKNCRTANK